MGIDTRFVVMYGIQFNLDDLTLEERDEFYELDSMYVRSMDVDGINWIAGWPYLITKSVRWDISYDSWAFDPSTSNANELDSHKTLVIADLVLLTPKHIPQRSS
jgi:hypothetical protein